MGVCQRLNLQDCLRDRGSPAHSTTTASLSSTGISLLQLARFLSCTVRSELDFMALWLFRYSTPWSGELRRTTGGSHFASYSLKQCPYPQMGF